MELIYDYMKDTEKRHMLNDLTQKTFWFDFENWVVGGYFEGDYIPYSFVEDGKMIANVSVNKMSFIQNGISKNYIQLGTVMTDEAYRKQGLAKKLMNHIIEEYKDKCDGFYLFANLEALDFYRKMGFVEGMQYSYSLKKEYLPDKSNVSLFRKADQTMKNKYMDYVRNSAVNSALEQSNKFGLQMFYTAGMENVYYTKDIDCFVILEEEENTIALQSIIAKEQISLKEICSRIDGKYDSIRLGFVPHDKEKFMCDIMRYDGGEDYRLFSLGNELESIEKEQLYFPELSHA